MHWTIIGGGLQGTTIALKLKNEGLKNEALTIIDPYSSLCERFNIYTQRISMPYLRSPFVHHIHPKPFHLKQYARYHQYTSAYYCPYKRPQRDMFMHHVHDLIHQFKLNDCHIQGKVEAINKSRGKWCIKLSTGDKMITDCVVIANGYTQTPFIPEIFRNKANVKHIFADNYHASLDKDTQHVVGSGISAAHLTLKLLNEHNHQLVHLWMNKDIEIHNFDADPGWLGPKKLNYLASISSSDARMKLIEDERHSGSMPMELFLRLKKYVQSGRLVIHMSQIDDVTESYIIAAGKYFEYKHILLATGFYNQLLTQPLIKNLIQNEQAPLNQSGYPSLSNELEWLNQLFVAGGLADLELGPFARNIMGGKESAERISKAYKRLNKKIS